jgi:hypothetical protein
MNSEYANVSRTQQTVCRFNQATQPDEWNSDPCCNDLLQVCLNYIL